MDLERIFGNLAVLRPPDAFASAVVVAACRKRSVTYSNSLAEPQSSSQHEKNMFQSKILQISDRIPAPTTNSGNHCRDSGDHNLRFVGTSS